MAVKELCETVAGLGTDETAEFSCADGFVSLTYQHITESNFKTYDADTGERCSHGAMTALLAYEVDGKPLGEDSWRTSQGNDIGRRGHSHERLPLDEGDKQDGYPQVGGE